MEDLVSICQKYILSTIAGKRSPGRKGEVAKGLSLPEQVLLGMLHHFQNGLRMGVLSQTAVPADTVAVEEGSSISYIRFCICGGSLQGEVLYGRL